MSWAIFVYCDLRLCLSLENMTKKPHRFNPLRWVLFSHD
nr:MAG TPA: hypothetical protein [Caudoviricetes sp.]